MSTEVRVPVVLLVEDDPGDVLMVTEALERSQRPPLLHVARDGQVALDLLNGPEALRPDLILLDLNMPRMDGRETLAKIKGDPELRGIPVVVFTTSEAETDVLASYRHHANAYVAKPLELDTLERVVDQIGHFYMDVSQLRPPHPHS